MVQAAIDGDLEGARQALAADAAAALDGEAKLSRGNAYLSAAIAHAARLPPGYPEGFIEAFANICRGGCRCIRIRAAGGNPDPLDMDVPTAADGAAHVRFIHRAIESGHAESWLDLNPEGAA